MFMYRRNLLFQSYEKGMLINVNNVYQQLSNLNREMSNWKDGASSWNLGDRQVSAYQCQAKYKKLTIKGWKTKYYNDIANRWTDYYEVSGSQELNLHPTKDAKVIEQLKIIGNFENDEDVTRIFNRKHYLLDPLMPGKTEAQGGLAFTRFGTHKNLKSGGLFGFLKKRDLRNPRYLKGVNVIQSYTGLRDEFKDRIIQYYKEMKLDQQQTGFIHEPELVSTDAVDCIYKMGKELESGDKCHEFNQYIEDVTNYGLAHFLAYSYHTNSKYSGYFTNAGTWRRMLFNRLEVDLQNINRYYEEVIKMRQQQTLCLESLINHVSDEYLNIGNTVSQGGNNYYYDGGKYSGNATETTKVKGKLGTLSEASRQKYSFEANVSSWKGVADSLVDASRGDMSSSSLKVAESAIGEGDVSTNTSAFNRRREAMLESNKKLSDKGIKVDDKNSKLLSSLGLKSENSGKGAGTGIVTENASSSSSRSGSATTSNSSNGSLDMTYQGSLGGDVKLDPESQVASIAPGGAFASENAGLSSRTTLSEGLSNSQGNFSSGGESALDPSGLSEDDKTALFANLERTKGQYRPKETDTLFDVVSKAYVRNLDKILTRKRVD